MLKSYVPSKVQEEFKMNEIAKVTNTMEETTATVDFLTEIRTVAKADFILQRHFRQNILYFFIHRAYSLSA